MTWELLLMILVVVPSGFVTLYLVIQTHSRTVQLQKSIYLIASELKIDLLSPENLSNDVKRLTRDRENAESGKRQAIELCREETGASFTDAVTAIERYIQSQKLPVK